MHKHKSYPLNHIKGQMKLYMHNTPLNDILLLCMDMLKAIFKEYQWKQTHFLWTSVLRNIVHRQKNHDQILLQLIHYAF